jgi:hypothetical protein
MACKYHFEIEADGHSVEFCINEDGSIVEQSGSIISVFSEIDDAHEALLDVKRIYDFLCRSEMKHLEVTKEEI